MQSLCKYSPPPLKKGESMARGQRGIYIIKSPLTPLCQRGGLNNYNWYGKEVVKVDRWFASSKTCSCCGWKNDGLTLADRIFECKACGLVLDRNLNASANILEEALRVNSAIRTQSGQKTFTVSPSKQPVLKRLENHGFL